jgi:hypothetical protein
MNTVVVKHAILISFILLIGCSDNETSAGIESSTALAARSWKGQSYVKLIIGDSSRVMKDLVLLFDLKKDGSCTLSQASYSMSNIPGQWKIDAEGKHITLTLNRPQATVTEILAIAELSSSRFVFGDTTMYGYSLVPL